MSQRMCTYCVATSLGAAEGSLQFIQSAVNTETQLHGRSSGRAIPSPTLPHPDGTPSSSCRLWRGAETHFIPLNSTLRIPLNYRNEIFNSLFRCISPMYLYLH